MTLEDGIFPAGCDRWQGGTRKCKMCDVPDGHKAVTAMNWNQSRSCTEESISLSLSQYHVRTYFFWVVQSCWHRKMPKKRCLS